MDFIVFDVSYEYPDSIGVDWVHDFMDGIGLGQQKWTHVQLWFREKRESNFIYLCTPRATVSQTEAV